MRVIVYVDGYNFYYGCLKDTPYKWLDLHKLFSQILTAQLGRKDFSLKVKFFTADVKASVSPRGGQSNISQNTYHRALKALYPDDIEIIKGYYSVDYGRLPAYRKGAKLDPSDKVEVWRLEEKQTDVNIALHMYHDAHFGGSDLLVLASNDTDLAPALEMIRKNTSRKIGVIIPVFDPPKRAPHRPPNKQLSQFADWTRNLIKESELAESQLPDVIPTRRKPIRKPDYW